MFPQLSFYFAAILISGKGKLIHQLLKALRLCGKLLAGSGAFLRGGAVVLHHIRDLTDPLRHLVHRVGLLCGHPGDLVNGADHVLHAAYNAQKGVRRVAGNLGSGPHSHGGILNKLWSALGRVRGLACQIAHLICHNGKAFARAARPGSLHSRVQSQDIGLESNILYGLDDLPDLIGAGADTLHSFHKFLHLFIAGSHRLPGPVGLFPGILSAPGRVPGLVGDLVDLGCQLLHGTGLLHRPLT